MRLRGLVGRQEEKEHRACRAARPATALQMPPMLRSLPWRRFEGMDAKLGSGSALDVPARHSVASHHQTEGM